MTAYHRNYFRSGPTIPALVGSAPVAGTRGLLPNAAARTLSSATPPVVRKVDDKGRIYHPDFAELVGWGQGTACTVEVAGDYLQVRPTDQPGRDRGRLDRQGRLRVPAARLLAIGVAPDEEVAVLVDAGAGSVTVAAAAHLTDAFWAIGELEQLRNQVSELTAERDAANAAATKAKVRADVLADVLTGHQSAATEAPLAHIGR